MRSFVADAPLATEGSEPILPTPEHGDAPTPRRTIGTLHARRVGLLAVGCSLIVSFVLMLAHRQLSGNGDETEYYAQASRLLPFNDHYYGPGYHAALRLLHDVTGLSWFAAGKLLSWMSAGVFLFLCYRVFAALLPPAAAWLSLALVALNPTVIGSSYSSLTIMFGAALLLVAIWLTIASPVDRPWRWLLCGVVFGFAYLTRFQSLGFFLGASAGLAVVRGTSLRRRIKAMLALAAGAAVPVLLWNALLLSTQGYVPANHNFVHLTLGLGRFKSFSEVPELLRYGSMLGVFRSEPLAPLRIMAYGAKEALVFPFYVAFPLVFLGAGFLVPGALRLALDRRSYAPWLGAFLAGLVLTGIGSQRWLHYYTVLIPFVVIVVASAVGALETAVPRSLGRIAWVALLVTTLGWSAFRVRSDFIAGEWTEVTVARRFIERTAPGARVSASAQSISYDSRFEYVDLDRVIRPGEWSHLVPRLRARGVTHLLVTERHDLDVLPELSTLLRDELTQVPPGLRRDTLIVTPRRLAIYRVLPASDSVGNAR